MSVSLLHSDMDFLSTRDAAKLIGKSDSTIKRLIREIVDPPGHPDRDKVLPTEKEMEAIKANDDPYAWKIDREFLLYRYPPEENPKRGATVADSAGTELVLTVLREQLGSKDEQIRTLERQLDRKDEQIGAMNERMREQHVLMQELQQRLAITSPKPRTQDAVTEEGTGPGRPMGGASTASKNSIWKRPLSGFFRSTK